MYMSFNSWIFIGHKGLNSSILILTGTKGMIFEDNNCKFKGNIQYCLHNIEG